VTPAVTVEEHAPALWLGLERPPLNVLDLAAIRELHLALAQLPARRDLKLVVLASRVAGCFSAGVDVADHAPARAGEMLDAFHSVFRLLDAAPQATLAAVDGHCLGGGCELATFCDIVLATPRARFGFPEIDLGCFPPVAAAWLPRVIGRRAFDLLLTGRTLDAAEAARVGLATEVVEDLEAAVSRTAALLGSKSGLALATARRALREGRDFGFSEALARSEALYRSELLPSHDAQEGVRAFLEKRPPRWRDR